MALARKEDLEYCGQVAEFLATTSLPLTPSLPPTLGDGNCWYRAIATQVQLAKIPGKPQTHSMLREAVADHLKMLPDNMKERILALLLGGRRRGMAGLSSVYRRDGQWLDDDGVMALATADYLGRDIFIYGFQVEGSKRPFSEIRVEGGGGADSLPPLTVFLHASHYQSLKEVTRPKVKTCCVRIEKLDTKPLQLSCFRNEIYREYPSEAMEKEVLKTDGQKLGPIVLDTGSVAAIDQDKYGDNYHVKVLDRSDPGLKTCTVMMKKVVLKTVQKLGSRNLATVSKALCKTEEYSDKNVVKVMDQSDLPQGWRRSCVPRKSCSQEGKVRRSQASHDYYLVTDQNRKFRSQVQLDKWMKEEGRLPRVYLKPRDKKNLKVEEAASKTLKFTEEVQKTGKKRKLESVSEFEECVYCVCRRPYSLGPMVGCDGPCKDWYHFSCLGWGPGYKVAPGDWYCRSCCQALG